MNESNRPLAATVADQEPIDVRHVVCNLVPTILAHLDLAKQHDTPQITFMVRQGIQMEMRSAFGTVGEWQLEIGTLIGHDMLRFTRRPPKKDIPDLHLLDY